MGMPVALLEDLMPVAVTVVKIILKGGLIRGLSGVLCQCFDMMINKGFRNENAGRRTRCGRPIWKARLCWKVGLRVVCSLEVGGELGAALWVNRGRRKSVGGIRLADKSMGGLGRWV